MTDVSTQTDRLRAENETLRRENARLHDALVEVQAKLAEPEQIIRAIREGEVDALVVEAAGGEEIYTVQRYESVYRDLVEASLPYGVWVADLDGRLIYVSRKFLDSAQTSLQEMVEKGQFHFLPESTRTAFEAQWRACRESGLPCDFEYSIRRADGTERTIWTHGILTHGYDGTPFWAGINLDVTEQRKIQDELSRKAEQLAEGDRRKDEFLALLGHELRNPLAVVQHGLDLLARTNSDAATFQKVVKPMTNQVGHLSRLVDDLLDVSRITRGTIDLRRRRVDLATAIQNAVGSVRGQVDAEGLHLSVSVPAQPVYLNADPTRLEQVLFNLLNNAVKYTPPGGSIELAATREHEEVVIRVADSGIGIPPELVSRIFELFVQSDRALDRAQGGLGIGLSVVRRLIELHGGSITAHSDGPDRGSEFVVRLPALPIAERDTAPVDAPPAAVPKQGGLRILVAEDSTDLVELLEMMLEALGHDVVVAADGPGAVQAFHAHRPDVVLLDVGLPEMDGYEVARQIRAHESGDRALLVAVTGYGQARDRQRSREVGFDHHLVKPADLDRLEEILATVARREPS